MKIHLKPIAPGEFFYSGSWRGYIFIFTLFEPIFMMAISPRCRLVEIEACPSFIVAASNILPSAEYTVKGSPFCSPLTVMVPFWAEISMGMLSAMALAEEVEGVVSVNTASVHTKVAVAISEFSTPDWLILNSSRTQCHY